METRKILAALSYFSIFFMGFILPAVLYFVSDDRYVKDHAKAAFLSHCIPLAAVVAAFVGMLATGIGAFGMNGGAEAAGAGTLVAMVLLFGAAGLVSLIVTIWNVVKGVQVLIR
ncbi:DUF4870 domain-containing protein [Paenibacillus sp.]|uniref:DUF4870 domain-containing protein n=1 Tax=Paenibacillus sp. TaxID=58172 RepID=UPI002D26D07D|nr:DUF4870 domain-containing protein [Paenibacillus sp.]HZG58530.1 DUF4870 domain-containing protein [Paenibacillus sp.]